MSGAGQAFCYRPLPRLPALTLDSVVTGRRSPPLVPFVLLGTPRDRTMTDVGRVSNGGRAPRPVTLCQRTKSIGLSREGDVGGFAIQVPHH